MLTAFLLQSQSLRDGFVHIMVSLTRANSTPAYLYAAGVQNAMQDSMVMPVTSVKDAILSVRLLVESLKYIQKSVKR